MRGLNPMNPLPPAVSMSPYGHCAAIAESRIDSLPNGPVRTCICRDFPNDRDPFDREFVTRIFERFARR